MIKLWFADNIDARTKKPALEALVEHLDKPPYITFEISVEIKLHKKTRVVSRERKRSR